MGGFACIMFFESRWWSLKISVFEVVVYFWLDLGIASVHNHQAFKHFKSLAKTKSGIWTENRSLGNIFLREEFLLDSFYLFVLLPRTVKVNMTVKAFL